MARLLTFDDIKKHEQKIKAEKAKVAKAKKEIINKENTKIGKLMRKKFGFKSYSDFEQWLDKNFPETKSKNVAKKEDKKSNMSEKNKRISKK
ncbi:hypothetical protein [Enterococcus cecorum]|uniref:hypothetical protein n=1 Tax=Enterococcus cecorum TaxID=44008 RepID=UPI000641863C|nr:hypothetical protein [Enterococcus cecorum]KLN95182.1 hypothetical protein ABT60_01305 [Enterococcus cecorum]